eukprot:g11862.t1
MLRRRRLHEEADGAARMGQQAARLKRAQHSRQAGAAKVTAAVGTASKAEGASSLMGVKLDMEQLLLDEAAAGFLMLKHAPFEEPEPEAEEEAEAMPLDPLVVVKIEAVLSS